MQAYHKVPLPSTGAAHALSVRLTPLQDEASSHGTVVSHLLTARGSLIQLYEVREFETPGQPSTAKLHHILTRRLHGTVTALSRIRTLASKTDGADRILVSFLDAKMSLLEWTPSAHDLLPVSLHTFEKLPQVIEGRAKTATDPASRLSVMLLPSNTGGDGTLAILPFFQEDIDLESLGVDADAWGSDGVASIPYAPSHLLPLASLTTSTNPAFNNASRSSTLANTHIGAGSAPPIRNVLDMVFLPGFNEPTLALLYSPEPTWVGRLENVSSNYLVSLVTLASGSAKAGGGNETTAVVIATSPPLPHSCLAVHPCPPDLGGTLIVTANGVLHLEQGGKVVGVAANGWFAKEWFGTGGNLKGEVTVREALEGSQVVFLSNSKAVLFAKSGISLELTLTTSGRSVSSMKLQKLGKGIAASCVERIRGSKGRFGEQGYVFVGSEVGESSLVKWEIGAGGSSAPVPVVAALDEGMDLDDDEDIYGTSEIKAVAVVAPTVAAPRILPNGRSLNLTSCDVIDGYGAIRSLTVGLADDECPPELVASTGGGISAGFTVFHRTISPRKRRKIDQDWVATSGVWHLSTPEGTEGAVIFSNATTTKISSRAGVELETADVTTGAFELADGFLRVTPTEIQVYGWDLAVQQSLPVQNASPAVRATFSYPVLSVHGKSAIDVFTIAPMTQELQYLWLPAPYDESLTALSIFLDSSNAVPLVRAAPKPEPGAAKAQQAAAELDEEDDLYTSAPRRPLASETLGSLSLVVPPMAETGAVASEKGLAWQWMPVVDAKGDLEILLLPSMQVVFRSTAIALFPDVMEDGSGEEITEAIDPDDVEIDRVICANLGQEHFRPHLIILLTNGSLAIYEAVPSISAASSSIRDVSLGVRFVKVLTKRLPLPVTRRRNAAADELPAPRREFTPFANLSGYSGLFVSGEDAFWIFASDHGPARIFEHAEKGVYAFSSVVEPSEEAQFLLQTRAGAYYASLPSEPCFDRELPYTRVPKDRRYASISFDIDSGLYVGGAIFSTVFMNFDEEGQPVFNQDSPELLQPRNVRSAVELILPGTWQAIDGYEFRPNEFISTLKSVSLATRSTASGRKDFIAVGTTVYRAEDLAARGGIYLFEIIPIVPDPSTPTHNHRLKLLFFEDTKSVVGNLCDINGHLVMSMGQKLYARAFEQDEVLLAVGFLDVGVHVTSLQSMKNFLLIGDALQSVTLVAFQEDPYKLVLLGRDYRASRVSSANFLINDAKVAFVVGDVLGVLRVFEYDPSNIASHAGQRLLCRTEYHAGAEGTATMLYAKRSAAAEEVKQNGILYGGVDGSLYTLVPVRDVIFKRLQLLQTALMRHVQHFAGLNPRGHRIVKNDSVSRAITKGILDGELLAEFETLSLNRQVELCSQIGTDPDTVLANLRNLATF